MDNMMATNSMFNDGGIIILLLFFLFMGGSWGGETAKASQVYDATAQQSTTNSLNDIKSAVTSSTYENANLINGINNNLNNIGNNIVTNMTHNYDQISAQINNLGYQMSQCCCDLKSQMLNDKYETVVRELNNAGNIISNQTQTQTLLSNMGRWYPYQGVNPYGYSGTTFA